MRKNKQADHLHDVLGEIGRRMREHLEVMTGPVPRRLSDLVNEMKRAEAAAERDTVERDDMRSRDHRH